MEIDCRPAGPGDVEVLSGLAARAREHLGSVRGGEALLDALRAGPDPVSFARSGTPPSGAHMVWCAAIDDVIIGYCSATVETEYDDRVVLVREVWVEPDAREVGAGEALVSAAMAWAIAEEATAIDAWALPGARELKNLFERLGLTARLLTVRRSL